MLGTHVIRELLDQLGEVDERGRVVRAGERAGGEVSLHEAAFDLAGIELIAENVSSQGRGRGVRFKEVAVATVNRRPMPGSRTRQKKT